MTHYSKSWTQALKEVYSFSEGATEDTKGDKEAYQKFFNSALKKFGVSSPSELEGSKKKEFYDYVDANWKGDNEKPEPEDKKEETEIEESYWKVSIPDMPPFFVEGGSASNIKMDMRTKLKPDVFKEVTVERVARADMIKKYKSMAKGESTEEVKEEVLLEAGAVQAVDPAKMGQKQSFGSRFSKVTSGIGKGIADAKKKRQLAQKQKDATSASGDAARVKSALEKDRQADVVKKAREKRDSEKTESVDLVDIIKDLISEAKPEFEVKYSSSKKGPIKVSKFMSLGDAKEFLAQVKKEGMNGIISKGGKPVKEHHQKDANGEPIPHDDEEDIQEKKEKKMKWQKTGLKNAEDDPVASKGDKWQKTGLKNEETINEADYQLYHKDFSSAMQHAYKHAKKKGFVVDPEHIDQKVAMGPKKPSSGKTNRYILGTNKSKNVHIQVANLDNKKFELNMYIEDTDLEEKWSKADQNKFNPKTPKHANRKTAKAEKDARHAELRRKAGLGEGAVGSSDQQHNALVATKARMEMKKALKSGKSQSQDWWNKQAKLAGLAKEHLEQPWWKQMVREDSITNPKISEPKAPNFGKDIKKNTPPKPKKTKTGESK